MTERKWWRAPGFLISGAFLTTLIVLGAVTLLTAGGDTPEPVAPVKPEPAQQTAGGCQIPGGDQRVPLTPPAAHWDRIGEQKAPGSSTAGPAQRAGHVRSCYARSPTGAVFAAYGFFAAVTEYPGDTRMLKALTAASRVRDEGLRRGGSPPQDPDWTVQLVGFRVIDYSPTAATVLLAARAAPTQEAAMQGLSKPGLATVQLRLRFEDGDWKAVAEPDGFKPEVIDSLAGLVPWSAP